jgi:DNA-3-methyladenine glycosylase
MAGSGNGSGPRLDRAFFAREPTEVARDLVGRMLLVPVDRAGARSGAVAHDEVPDDDAPDNDSPHDEVPDDDVPDNDGPDGDAAGAPILLRLTETEAYHGEQDPASHAYRGPTERTRVMFGPPGFLYVYFVYGMHWFANVVTGVDGEASAVLLRGAEVVGNLRAARQRRRSAGGRVPRDVDLARGPARLASTIGLTGADSGADLVARAAGPSSGPATGGSPPFTVHAGAGPARQVRTGPRVGVAAGAETPWRFYDPASPAVSDYRAGGRRRGHAVGRAPEAWHNPSCVR